MVQTWEHAPHRTKVVLESGLGHLGRGVAHAIADSKNQRCNTGKCLACIQALTLEGPQQARDHFLKGSGLARPHAAAPENSLDGAVGGAEVVGAAVMV